MKLRSTQCNTFTYKSSTSLRRDECGKLGCIIIHALQIRDRQVEELVANVQGKDQHIATIQGEIANKDEQIVTMEGELANREECVATMEGELANRNKQMAIMDCRIKQLEV